MHFEVSGNVPATKAPAGTHGEPRYGRFLQPDPLGYEDSPNLYAYVRNDPVNLIDPLGLAWACVGVGENAMFDCAWFGAGLPGGVMGVGGSGPGASAGQTVIVGPRVNQNPNTGSRMPQDRPKQNQFTCADALKEKGEVSAHLSVGGSIGYGKVGVGGGFSGAWNESGSGGGFTFDLGSPNLPSLSLTGSFTETTLSNCRPSGS